MDHSIKLDRALSVCKFRPMQQREILKSLPSELLGTLTAKDLATVMQALDAHWHKAVAFAEASVLAEGCIWDGGSQTLREISGGQPRV